jgi:phosphoglycolate phosphatase-like HAD superfamily hydrolase
MSKAHVYTRSDLLDLKPRHTSFVGIDSDGCVFPTMEIKQKQCFHSLIVSTWHLEPIEAYVREAAEFVNLHSCHRGQNRFPSLLRTFELLADRPEVRRTGVKLPPIAPLKKYCESGLALGHPTLEPYVRDTRDPEMERVLKWSQDVNARVAAVVKNIKPFRWVIESLEDIAQNSDAICVSQTPTEALVREWEENHLLGYVKVIAGQELGTKSEHLTMATGGRYPIDRVLMLGDAPGDLKAARQVGARFFPINPGHEEASWELFHKDVYKRFLDGTYTAETESDLVRHFEALLPDTPPWIKNR